MDEPPQKRFRYTTYNQQINNINIDVGKNKGVTWEKEEFDDAEETKTPFTSEVARLSLLDLTLPFQELQKTLYPLTTSLPITLLNLPAISEAFYRLYDNVKEGEDNQHSGLDSAAQLHLALFETCQGECLPYLPATVGHLVRIGAGKALDPKLVERTFSTLSLILRTSASFLLKSDTTSQATLQATWDTVRPYLAPKTNKKYVRKCVADAWAGVVRKARSEGLSRLINVLVESEAEGLEAVWANSLKGNNHHLHSRALPIINSLLDRLCADSSVVQLTTMNLVITAMVHHCSSTAIVPVIEAVTERLAPNAGAEPSTSKTTAPLASSSAMLSLLSTLLLTRKGKRYPENLLKPTMEKLKNLLPVLANMPETANEIEEGWKRNLVLCIVGSLQAGKLAQWLSPGVSLIDGLWAQLSAREAFAFVNALVDLRWSGVEQFLLPHVAKTALPTLASDPLPTLQLLNHLASAGCMSRGLSNVQGGRWRQSLISTLRERLAATAETSVEDIDRRILGQLLRLLSTLPCEGRDFTPSLISLLNKYGRFDEGDAQSAIEEWQTGGAWNNAHMISSLMRCADAHILDKEVQSQFTTLLVDERGFQGILRKWNWNAEVLGSTIEIVTRGDLAVSLSEIEQDILTPHLLSSNSSLRKAVLRILNLTAAPGTKAGDIWNACLLIESSEVTLKNVRERTANIAKLGRMLASQPKDENDRSIEQAMRYLVAQLKVNFRPLYAETITNLTTLAGTRGETLWTIVWEQLQRTIAADKSHAVDLDWEEPDWTRDVVRDTQGDSDAADDDEAEFRCPNLFKGRRVLSKAWMASQNVQILDTDEITSQVSQDRLDILNYEAQLLATLGAAHSLAEKHSRLLVPVFLTTARRSTSEDDMSSALSTRQLQNRTTSFLEVFTKFVNPKAFYRSDEVHELYLDILARGEPKLQGLAVKCLITYKSPSLTPYAESLLTLLDESRFRDGLVNFNLGADSEDIDPQHREEIVPVTIRLLYGILISKRGRSTSSSLGARKQAILTAFSSCRSEELGTLVDLMLEPFEKSQAAEDSPVNVPGRQQLGFLTLLHDVIRYLGPQTVAYWPRLLGSSIALIDNAQTQLGKGDQVIEDEDAAADQDAEDLGENEKGNAPLRSIRSTGIKRVVQFIRAPTSFDFRPFLPSVFKAIISPRLDKLEKENTQAPSGTLDLIAALAASPLLALSLVELDDRTLVKTFACLTAVKVKPAVISRVFDVIEHLLADSTDDGERPLTTRVLLPNMRALLDNIIRLVPILAQQSDDELLRRLLGILSRSAGIVTDNQQAQQLASLLGPMLKLPGKKLPERNKANVLATLQQLYTVAPDFADSSSAFFSQNYNLISNLFQTLWMPATRKALVQVHQTFATVDSSLSNVVKLSADINAYSERRKEEPNFDKRLNAFARINDCPLTDLPQTPREWLPLLRNGLFYLAEQEELSIRTNASNVMQRFISLVADKTEGPMVDMLQQVIMPGLRKTLQHKSELVRNEALLVLSHAIKTCSGVPVLVEMVPLLGTDDDEVNFFTNVSHIQVHRRSRALRRLREVVAESNIREQTISTILLPVLEHMISGSTDVTDHHLVNEAIISTGSMTGQLVWSRYSATIMRFLRLGTVKTAQQKFYIRTVSAILDNFHFDLKARVADVPDEGMDVDVGQEDAAGQMNIEMEGVEDSLTTATKPPVNGQSTTLITDAIINRLLPALSKFAESKDETEDNIRVPISLGIVKLAHALPGDHATHEIVRIVTSVSNVLKSKDQDTRDIARETICKIALFLGPDWLVRVLKELRTALQRGPQKHVLAVTTHHILVQATADPENRFSDLDDAVEDAVQISAEVVWGESGKDVVAEGFKSKMREVRGANSRGLDTMQLIARLVSPSKLSVMLTPVREIMHASQAIKTMLQVDEALRRISLGLNANDRLGAEDVLSLCYSLISGNSSYIQPKKKATKASQAADSFRVQMKRNNREQEDFYPLNAHKFIGFGLDLFVTAFKRGRFDFDNVDILARIGPLVPAIGNTLYSTTSGVLVLGLKATAAIVRCPVHQVEESISIVVTNIFRIIKNAGGTAESDLAQTALKTLAVILRDNRSSSVSDKQLRYLLEVIEPDIEESDRQSAIFTVLRSIVGRKLVVPEIYDLMDRVSAIMVTNQSTHVQELCRGVLMAFLLDYPQGAGRLKAQMTFLARNLNYQFESGRISVMEVLSAVLTKFSDDLIQEYADMLFVALVAALAGDDSEKCRTMAAVLIKVLLGRLGNQQKEKTLQVLKSWVEMRDEQIQLASASLAVYAIVIETSPDLTDDVLNVVLPALEESGQTLQRAESSEDDIHLDHRVPLNALKAIVRSLEITPSSAKTLPWESIVQHLLFPHVGVRIAAARCISILLASNNGIDGVSLLGEETLMDVARKSCLLFRGDETDHGRTMVVDNKLADVLVKILWHISKHWASSYTPTKTAAVQEEAEDGESDHEDAEADAFIKAKTTIQPLAWLMSRMSFLARHLIVNRPAANSNMFSINPWTQPLMAILRFFAGVMERLDQTQAKGFLVHVLNPIHRITDESGDLSQAQGEGLEDLRQLATEVRDHIQTKVGVTDFSRVWENLRRHTSERREGRRQAKNQMAIRDPVAWADRQGKRSNMKKESKKRKVKSFADGKVRERPTKRRT